MNTDNQDRNPTLFFILTFVFAWGLWLPSILAGLGVNMNFNITSYTLITIPIGAFAPFIAALTLIIRKHGWKESWNFIRQAFDFKTKPIYFVLAILIPIIINAAAHYIAPLMGFEVANSLFPDDLAVSPILLSIPYFIIMLLIGGGQEEFGWRGYALDPLKNRMGLIPASLLIGFIWGLWHLPLWIMPGENHSTYSFIAFLIMTTSISIVYSWLYYASNKKLIIVLILHAMCNTAAPLLPFLLMEEGKPESAYWVYAGFNVIAALITVVYMRKTKSLTGNVKISQ
ncbi:MAG: CPBP family intramembrane metalloprotease [Anaerolineaceae bacterium]|nr:CPBP family intramembrane metalloprotease [Anaerolineaceae bacterium]